VRLTNSFPIATTVWHAHVRSLADPAVQGQWSTLTNRAPINPIHSALLPNGNVLFVAGSGIVLLISQVAPKVLLTVPARPSIIQG
jgi:hypothetical protein